MRKLFQTRMLLRFFTALLLVVRPVLSEPWVNLVTFCLFSLGLRHVNHVLCGLTYKTVECTTDHVSTTDLIHLDALI